MATKLTLRMDEELIDKAKKEASLRGVSLSKLVADYFRTLSRKGKTEISASPVLSEVSGILSGKSDGKSLGRAYRKHLEDKYL